MYLYLFREKVDLTKYCEQHKYVFDNCFNQDDDNYKVCIF
jgi:hypothetical protein